MTIAEPAQRGSERLCGSRKVVKGAMRCPASLEQAYPLHSLMLTPPRQGASPACGSRRVLVGSQRALHVPEPAPAKLKALLSSRREPPDPRLSRVLCLVLVCRALCFLFPHLSLRGCGGNITVRAKCQGVNACAVSDRVLPFRVSSVRTTELTALEPPWCRACRPVFAPLVYLLDYSLGLGIRVRVRGKALW
jgi:hypothetical protein